MLGTFGGALEAPNIDSSKRSSLPAACRYWIQHTTNRLSRARCPTSVHSAPRGDSPSPWLTNGDAELSLTGCYLDTTNFLPVGAEVRLRISHHDATFTALGVVASCQPNMGMGVRFTDVQLDQHAILDKWLAELV